MRKLATILFILLLSINVFAESIVSSYEKELFVGKWYSTRARVEINIYLDGTWSITEDYSGKWILEADKFVWIYKGKGKMAMDFLYNEPDKNLIISVNDDEFILEELDGSKIIFRRIKNKED